jgi:V/A-type H+/Na+-transporting ATPase subunit D
MERLALSVNKSNLLRLKEELSFAREGRELLDEKKEALMAHISGLATKAERVRSQMNQILAGAYAQLQEAIIRHGSLACERAALATRAGEDIDVREKSFMGVALPILRLSIPRFLPSYGFQETGASLDAVAKTILDGLEIMVELAEIEVGLARLIYEIKMTIKRLNALENIYIPRFEATVKHLEDNLEEKEREFLFQLKRQKTRKSEAAHGAF